MTASTAARRRIAFFLPDMRAGGAERIALASIRDLVRRGADVDLVLARAEGELLALLPAEVTVVDLKASRIIKSLWPVVGYLKERQPDAIHAMMWPVTIVALAARRLARSRASVMVSEHTTLSRHVRAARQSALLRLTTRLFYPGADHLIACSAGVADDLSGLSGIDRRQFTVIHGPISPPEAIATNPQVERLWGDAAPRIITVGSLNPAKNQALLLRAFAQVRGYPNARLMIVGEGPLRGDLQRLAAELGIAERVLMPGFAVDPWPYLASADLFALSSDYEGFPLVLAEAMQAGLKVVSTDCQSGPAEMLDGGRYGGLVPCGDVAALARAMEQALAEPSDPVRMRRRADAMAGTSMTARYSQLLMTDKE